MLNFVIFVIFVNTSVAQINLLKQKTSSDSVWQTAASILTKLLLLGVLALVGFYGWQFIQIGKIEQKITAAQLAISQAQQSVATITNRDELYTRQAQLQQQEGLVSKHLYFSNLFPALARVTLREASYNSITATKEGQLDIQVMVPDLLTVDKFLQVFDRPEFNVNFNNLRIGSVQKNTEGSPTGYSFDARFNFNPALLQYQDPKKANGQ